MTFYDVTTIVYKAVLCLMYRELSLDHFRESLSHQLLHKTTIISSFVCEIVLKVVPGGKNRRAAGIPESCAAPAPPNLTKPGALSHSYTQAQTRNRLLKEQVGG